VQRVWTQALPKQPWVGAVCRVLHQEKAPILRAMPLGPQHNMLSDLHNITQPNKPNNATVPRDAASL
jgi:hypothetical protein